MIYSIIFNAEIQFYKYLCKNKSGEEDAIFLADMI